ncbi:hypothetical protein KSP40_PGU013360 [Platanthera guangdongensis]|uniref:Uncharacterized protein n=1 Tax=Platanthera guangdongensis TaxID=2320717 RepID=A0ABR2LP62_9ASPA
MAIPGPYSGVSTLAFVSLSLTPLGSIITDRIFSYPISLLEQVARASALTFGVVYGSLKLSYLKVFPGFYRPLWWVQQRSLLQTALSTSCELCSLVTAVSCSSY